MGCKEYWEARKRRVARLVAIYGKKEVRRMNIAMLRRFLAERGYASVAYLGDHDEGDHM